MGHQLFLGLSRHLEVHHLGNLLMVALIDLHDALVGILGAIQIVGAAVHVQREVGRRHADQHQHHQTDTLLAIVGAVHKADPHGRSYQREASPERRMLLAIHQQALFRCFVDLAALPDTFHGKQQYGRNDETDGGRDDEGEHDVDGFADVDAFLQRLMVDPGIGAAYPQDGADQRVRAGCGDPEEPGAQVPHDGGKQQGEHHDKTLGRVHSEQQIDGQQVNNGIGHPQPAHHDPGKVEQTGGHHGRMCRHSLGIDDRCYRVGGIVKAIDEFIGQHKKNGQYQTD